MSTAGEGRETVNSEDQQTKANTVKKLCQKPLVLLYADSATSPGHRLAVESVMHRPRQLIV